MNFLKKIFGSRSKDCGNLSYYKSLIGFTPRHVEYYEAAFTHKSVNKEDGEGHKVNYERLEFLGDAVLGVVIADYLFTHVPQGNEGYLTQMRAKIVSREQLNMIGKNLHFEKVIKSSFLPSSIPLDVYGNTMEALIGAIYKDRGYEKCRKFIYRVIIEPYVNISALEHKVSSYKSLMIQLAQKSHRSIKFEVCDEKSEDLQQLFGVKLILDGKCVAKGRGSSKKKAEERAAKRAFYSIKGRRKQKNRQV